MLPNNLDEFLEYTKPYLSRIEKEYKIFIRVLKKSGFSNEKEYLQIILFPEINYKKIDKIIGNRLKKNASNEKIKDVAQLLHANKFSPDVNFEGKFKGKLTKQEVEVSKYVLTFLVKLYINFAAHHGDIHGSKKAVLKPFLQQFLSDDISLYGTKRLIEDVSNHIDTLRTPAIEDLLIVKRKTRRINIKKKSVLPEQISLPYYWNYGIEKLNLFYKLLLDEKLIVENSNFINSFATYKTLAKQKTIWNGKQTHLVFLFYLIYNGTTFKGENIFKIIDRLFCKPDRTSFLELNLNIAYGNNSKLFANPNLLTKSFFRIKFIANELYLKKS
jgi:hypothetical protein